MDDVYLEYGFEILAVPTLLSAIDELFQIFGLGNVLARPIGALRTQTGDDHNKAIGDRTVKSGDQRAVFAEFDRAAEAIESAECNVAAGLVLDNTPNVQIGICRSSNIIW